MVTHKHKHKQTQGPQPKGATWGNRTPVGISAVGSRRVTQSVRNARDLLREPLRHASNLGGPFRLRSLLPAVSLGPPEGATTHY